jgi:hypothetical protein
MIPVDFITDTMTRELFPVMDEAGSESPKAVHEAAADAEERATVVSTPEHGSALLSPRGFLEPAANSNDPGFGLLRRPFR